MPATTAIVFLFSGAALTMLGVVLYKRLQEDEKKGR
jgi:hypothetical protein